ncbi:MAG: response regulator [Clostridiales bacterium]|jgi:CheY-like chemotaxis protein/HPt (histidine-containing phosphotransfer) domain-containing protein|nr:response regulator [Clostridiales bacterium]
MRTIGDFLAELNHEIRTPTNAIVGFTELLLDEDVSPPVKEYLEKIHIAANTLIGVINDRLDALKIESGEFMLAPVKKDFFYEEENPADFVRTDFSWAKVLVVDDYVANLDVARGLFAKYKIDAICVTSGMEAIDLINRTDPVFDIIFMDHMMPGMDGVESTQIIRSLNSDYAKSVPIIAFTANTVAGSEQLFLKKGFHDFLAKPVSMKKLDAILHKWLDKKSPTDESKDEIPGIDRESVFALYEDDAELFKFILRSFVKNVPTVLENLHNVNEENFAEYATNIHAVKGNCGSIGAKELAARAFEMEKMAREGDYYGILELNSDFIADTLEIIEHITAWLPKD